MFRQRGGGMGIGVVFESFFVPSLGILTTNFAPHSSVGILRKGYFIKLELYSSTKGWKFDQKLAKNI